MEDYVERIKKCSCCGKEFSLFFFNLKDYVYKEKSRGATYWFCSYPCYRKGVDYAKYGGSAVGERIRKYNTLQR